MRIRILILAGALLVTPAFAAVAGAQPANQSREMPEQIRPRRALPPYLFMLWRQQHPGERFGQIWTSMSEQDRQKLRSDLQAKWDALSADQQNDIRARIRDLREQRRARRLRLQGQTAAAANGANQVSSAPAETAPSGDAIMNTTAMPVTLVTAIITILALLFYFWTGLNVGRMRGKHGIKAPAMTGNPEFECAVRVQMNTLEWIVVFLPMLWLATVYFSPAMSIAWLGWLPAAFGVLWIAGRVLYMTGYMQAPEKRELGFGIAAFAVLGLLIMAIIGIVMQWTAAGAA